MSIEATTISKTTSTTKAAETSTSATSSTAATTAANSKSFKDELETVKAQDTKTAEAVKTAEATKEAEATKTAEVNQNTEKTAAEAATKAQQTTVKNKTSATTLGISENDETNDVLDPINELTSKISTLNAIKKGFVSTTKGVDTKTEEINDKNTYCQTMKMDNKDISFFVNLVENQQMSAGNATGGAASTTNNFTEIKSEATQQTVQVSQTLMDALNEASKTGKPLRIDFDKDIAVIMKIDKNGTLSANFIPGDAAVENYLRNNIASLRQSFDDQNLPYNELSYSRQQQKEEQQKRKNNKENKDE